MSGAEVGGWAGFASVMLSVFGWILRNIVASIVRAEMEKQSKWISTKFQDMQTALNSHVSRYHNVPGRK